jgi:hypothetical protein
MTMARYVLVLLVLGGCAARESASPPSPRPGGEELWIVARSNDASARTQTSEAPRMFAGTTADAPALALERTAVEGTVVGTVAALRLHQTYAGPDTATDGALVLPLPSGAMLYDLVLRIGSRHIRAIVGPREEAEALYAAALRSGRTASLLGERNGVVLGMAHLAAHTPIELELAYAQLLPWRDGAWELVVPRLAGGAVGVTVDLDAVGPISTVESPTHAIERTDVGDGRVRVTVREPATLHDADLVLRYAVAADDRPGGAVAVTSGTRGSAALIVLHPVVRAGRARAFGVDTIDWGTLDVEGSPRRLHVNAAASAGWPFVLSARVVGGTPGVVRVTTSEGGRNVVRTLTLRTLPPGAADAASILIASAELRATDDREERRRLALRYGLVSPETALIAIDATSPDR